MIRGATLVLAVGLVILWLVGLGQHATGWLTWLDGLGAALGFIIAGSSAPAAARATRRSVLIALAVGLGVLWIIGLATRTEWWLTWWTFGFAVAYLLLGIIAGGSAFDERITTSTTQPRAV